MAIKTIFQLSAFLLLATFYSASAAAFGPPFPGDVAEEVTITDAALVIKWINFHPAHEDGDTTDTLDEDEETTETLLDDDETTGTLDDDDDSTPTKLIGPFIIDIPTTEGSLLIDTSKIPAGQYSHVHLKMTPLEDPDDPDLKNFTDLSTDTFVGVSLYIAGVVHDGETTDSFTFVTDMRDNIRIPKSVEVVEGGKTSLMFQLDTSKFFLVGGQILDPRDPDNFIPIRQHIRFLLHHIRPLPPQIDDVVKLEAAVQAVGFDEFTSLTTLQMVGQTIYIADRTEFDDCTREDALTTGARLEIKGFLGMDGKITALEVECEEPENEKTVLKAPVESITRDPVTSKVTSLEVLGLTVLITDKTMIEYEEDEDESTDSLSLLSGDSDDHEDKDNGSLDQLDVGDWVMIAGVLTTEGSLLAFKIDDEEPRDEVKVESKIDEVIPGDSASSPTLIVAGIEVELTSQTQVVNDDHEPYDLMDLGPGLRVEVKGAWQGGIIVAETVKVKDEHSPDTVSLEGAVRAIQIGDEVTTLTVAGIPVVAENDLMVFAFAGIRLAPGDVEIGTRVKVHGSLLGEDAVLARHIHVKRHGWAGYGIDEDGFKFGDDEDEHEEDYELDAYSTLALDEASAGGYVSLRISGTGSSNVIQNAARDWMQYR